MQPSARTYRSTLFTAIAALVCVVLGLPAVAYQVPSTAGSVSGGVGTTALNGSGLTATYTATGKTIVFASAKLNFFGYKASDFTPTLASTTDIMGFDTYTTTDCPAEGTCSGLGTITVTFNRPVRNPVLSMVGVGGYQAAWSSGRVAKQSFWHSIFTVTTPGVTLTKLSGTNLTVDDGLTITSINPSTSSYCNQVTESNSGGPVLSAQANALCGSVRINGTVSSVSFDVSAQFTRASASLPGLVCNRISGTDCRTTNDDGYGFVITADEDFGDAPTSYNAGNAARAVISDVAIGSGITADNVGVANLATSPYTANDDTDDLTTLPTMHPGDSEYTVTVPMSGASRAGTLCGWIDVNHSGTFTSTSPNERTCTTFAAGATSTTLTWTSLPTTAPGDSWARFRIGYNTTQTQSPTGASDSGEVEDVPIVITAANPAISLTKTATPTTVTGVGHSVNYVFVVKNTGNTTLTSVNVTERAFSGTGATPAITCPTTRLTAGETMTCVASYTTTQADVDAGTITNTARATGTSGTGATVTADDVAQVTITHTPALALVKTVSPATVTTAGQTVTYTFRITNTGNISMSSVTVTETAFSGSGDSPIPSCPTTDLTPGAHLTCTASYALTAADIEAGAVFNTAVAEGTGSTPTGGTTPPPTRSAPASATVTAVATPGIAITKKAYRLGDAAFVDPIAAGSALMRGTDVVWRYTVTNTGNVPLTGVVVQDQAAWAGGGPFTVAVTCPATTLGAGQSMVCTGAGTM